MNTSLSQNQGNSHAIVWLSVAIIGGSAAFGLGYLGGWLYGVFDLDENDRQWLPLLGAGMGLFTGVAVSLGWCSLVLRWAKRGLPIVWRGTLLGVAAGAISAFVLHGCIALALRRLTLDLLAGTTCGAVAGLILGVLCSLAVAAGMGLRQQPTTNN